MYDVTIDTFRNTTIAFYQVSEELFTYDHLDRFAQYRITVDHGVDCQLLYRPLVFLPNSAQLDESRPYIKDELYPIVDACMIRAEYIEACLKYQDQLRLTTDLKATLEEYGILTDQQATY